MTQRRPHLSAPADGSRTTTLRDTQPHQDDDAPGPAPGDPVVGVLKLRGAQRRTRQRVAWDAAVVDNEGCGKKKSKVCCIYHKPRPFDESSSDSASDSDSDSNRGSSGDRARPTGRCRHASHAHERAHGSAVRRDGQGGTMHKLHRSDSDSDVNAYERAPKRKS